MAITFDPSNKRIILDSTSVEVKDIYSRWKEWVQQSDNAKYAEAMSVVGGDPLGGGLYVASYFFLLNGWRLRPMEQNHTLVLDGAISVEGGGQPVVQTLGSYNVSVQYTIPVQAQGIATSGTTGPTAGEIAAAVLASLQSTEIPVNIKKVNDLIIAGIGTESNPWGPV